MDIERMNAYITELFAPEDDVLRSIQEEAKLHGLPDISIQPFEGRLMQWLMRSINAGRVVELGTLAGYSGVWIARALPPGGRLYTLEKNGQHASVARRSFERAGVADRVELLEGSAIEQLVGLAPRGPFDMVFIDADKVSYEVYLAWAINNLRPGGMLAAHNALRGGRITAPESDDDRAMAAFNRALATDSRLDSFILAIGDGMAVGIKRG